jgi:hypothetical protein
MIMAIACYFVLFWGFEALRILTSPTYGLEDVWRSQEVFGIGRFIGIGPEGLLKLAAVIGALKLTVAGVCAVHILDRFRALMIGTANSEILETGLMIAVALSIASVAPAIWTQNGDLVREQTIQLLLAGLAAALCIIERSMQTAEVDGDELAAPKPASKSVIQPALKPAVAARPAWYAPWRA